MYSEYVEQIVGLSAGNSIPSPVTNPDPLRIPLDPNLPGKDGHRIPPATNADTSAYTVQVSRIAPDRLSRKNETRI
jgi:hypothetical protein